MLLQPRMMQSIEVLQLSTAELAQYIETAAERNEAVCVERPRVEDDGWRPSRATRASREATDRHDEMLQAEPDREKGVVDRALDELALLDLAPDLARWARFLVGCLDENGWLSASDEELLKLARESGLEPDVGLLGRAIAIVQSLEPRGIGGRNAVEALLLQLDPRHDDYALSCRLLEDFLEDVARNKLPAVARALGIDVERLNELLGELRLLSPRPAAEAVDECARSITPDVVVEATANGFDVRVERSGLPAISIEPDIVALARDRSQPREVRAYLRGKVEEARWLVEAVEGRRATLLRVARAACQRQGAYLREGPGHLAPLSMSEIAEELGLAVSTVSRTVADKFVETPFGIVALRSFFQTSGAGSETTAIDDVLAQLKALFESEDPAKPLSDDDAVAALAERGLHLARRTVAKHRAELGIQSSYRRRKHS